MKTVNLLQFFPWAFIMHLVRALIVFNISNTILKNKYNTAVTLASIVGFGIIYSGVSLVFIGRKNELFFMFGYYLMMFCILLAVTNGTIFSKFFAAIFSLIAYLSSSLMYSVVFNLLFGIDLGSGFKFEIPLSIYITQIVFVFSFSFIFIVLIRILQTKKENAFSIKSKYTLFLVFPITHIFGAMQACSAFITIQEQNGTTTTLLNNKNIDIFVLLFSVICLVADFTLVLFINKFEKVEKYNMEVQKEIMKNTLNYNQMQMLNDEKQEFRKLRHDYLNIIATAKGFIEINKPEKALSLFQNISDDLTGLSGFSVCSNETINTIFYTKIQQAKAANIKFTVNIDENYAILIDEYDLCRILCNLIDNALNAAKLSNLDKLCNFYITINEDCLIIESKNNFTSAKQSKPDKSALHGNGIGIIKEIISKYDGTYLAKQECNVWFTEVKLKNKANKAVETGEKL